MSATGASPRSVLALPALIVVAYAFARAWLLHEAAIVDVPHRELLTGFVPWPTPLHQADQIWPVLTAWLIAPVLAGAIGFRGESCFVPRVVGWARALGLATVPLTAATALLIIAAHVSSVRPVAFGAWFLAWPALAISLSLLAARNAEPRRARRWLSAALAVVCFGSVEVATLWPWWTQLLMSGMP